MPDRADYLARILIARLTNLQAKVAEDGRAEPDRQERIQVIEKVLAVEMGITDGITMALIEATAPSFRSGARAPDRDVASFADFLRRRLGDQLTES